MGYYLETSDRFNKADEIIARYPGARIVDAAEAKELASSGYLAIVCVVKNEMFEAAAFCHDNIERFMRSSDPRPKTWIVVYDRSAVERDSGYAAAVVAGDEG